MRSKARVISRAGALALPLVVIIGTGTAMAGSGGSTDVGHNIGSWLGNLGQDLLIPIAGVLGLAAFVRRDVGHAITILVIAVIVGIFVYDKGGAENLISSIASTATGK